ncbi:hypothetical protein [Microbulbifer sediminum]|uniref:hypothetical protein n=1 Tax=Microbulbifer sediminum TaxID=2904250 RepID=UPI001F216088|nr:hypothetical protein [Microbulbifer sediminum]
MFKSRKLNINYVFGQLFSFLFIAIAATILVSTIFTLLEFIVSSPVFYKENEIPEIVVNAISNLIIALAAFELHVVMNVILSQPVNEERTLRVLLEYGPRFIIVVSVALCLEGLVLVIKFSQANTAENLIYAIVVVLSASLLLLSLAIYVKLVSRAALAEEKRATNPLPNKAD